jgi:hypothetical protein
MPKTYRALVSSDWNQCLAPCGPFDVITYHYPELATDIDPIFQGYTGNRISLTTAVEQISALLPAPITAAQMDAYLADQFQTYTSVPELMRACEEENILFMINTTGMIGYFQRALAAGLLPPLAVLSAHPMTRYAADPRDPAEIYSLLETTDKGIHTAAVAAKYNIPASRIIILGDSGGDGPHFAWGAQVGATLIASMAKPSLIRYCAQRHITISHFFGNIYARKEDISPENENHYNLMALWPMIVECIGNQNSTRKFRSR